jgi:dipeptidyl aminopeptidase/acylaminoacyl peptidase
MNYILTLLFLVLFALCQAQGTLQPLDIFDLEFAADPQISPDGKSIVFVRSSMDIMTDARISNLWITDLYGNKMRPLTEGRSAMWLPDGESLLYISSESGKNQIHKLWLDNGQTAQITNLQQSVSNLQLSPDGKWLAMTMSVESTASKPSVLPSKPKGAKWADAPIYIDRLVYRSDGGGYTSERYSHIFIMPSDGGTPTQITKGDYNHRSPSWSADSKSIYFSSNQAPDWEYNQQNTEVFTIDLATRTVTQLTERYGPDASPVVSPSGNQIAYLGYDDKKMGYHHTRIYVMDKDGSNSSCLTCSSDFSFGNIQWSHDGNALYAQYDKEGNTKVAKINKGGQIETVASDLGGTSIGRPYDGGDYDAYKNVIAYTTTTPTEPTELAVSSGGQVRRLTSLNNDILAFKKLGEVEEIWYKSSYDGQRIQGWIIKPPGFDASKKYPLILEIHGGPFANYGDRFTPELQLMASKGYAVLYTNPRGSTSYGEEFANLIHHNYPSNDYDDLMSGVDEVIAKGYIDEDRLFVTGGSGGGVLTSWIIGNTDRFAAAVVAKPVINWYSWALTADISGVVNYWFPGMPWEHEEHYMKRSPISLVGNVTTPTMLLTGENDYRTPMSESEQYYQALKLQKVPSALVRIQGAGHGIAAKPSNLLAKVGYITGWFEQWDAGIEKK